MKSIWKEIASEALGTALLANTLATGAGLVAFILTFGPISGAHFNPAVTLCDAWMGGLSWRKVPGYILGQVAGAFLEILLLHRLERIESRLGFPPFHGPGPGDGQAKMLLTEMNVKGKEVERETAENLKEIVREKYGRLARDGAFQETPEFDRFRLVRMMDLNRKWPWP